MTVFLLGIVVAGGVFGDLLKAHAMRTQGSPSSFDGISLAKYAWGAFQSAWFLLSLVAYTASFFGFMALLSIRDVSFVVPATAVGYVLETLLARWLLREQVSARRWAGAGLVVAGVCLIA